MREHWRDAAARTCAAKLEWSWVNSSTQPRPISLEINRLGSDVGRRTPAKGRAVYAAHPCPASLGPRRPEWPQGRESPFAGGSAGYVKSRSLLYMPATHRTGADFRQQRPEVHSGRFGCLGQQAGRGHPGQRIRLEAPEIPVVIPPEIHAAVSPQFQRPMRGQRVLLQGRCFGGRNIGGGKHPGPPPPVLWFVVGKLPPRRDLPPPPRPPPPGGPRGIAGPPHD